MTSVPIRHPIAVLACLFGAFAGGPALGLAVASWSAPGSMLAGVVSWLAFALAFFAGLAAWFGIGLAAAVAGALWRVIRGRWRWERGSTGAVQVVPAGYGAFVPLGIGFGLLAGVVAGLVPQSPSFWTAFAAHAAAGAAYGASLRALARRGYLPFPEPG